MKSRLIASIVLGTAVVLGTTGCNMLAPQATTYEYDPGDGVSAHTGSIKVLNAFVVSEDGKNGNLVVAFSNEDPEAPATVNIEFGENGKGGQATVRVPAGELVSLGGDEEAPLLLKGINSKPGTLLPMSFQSGDGEGELTMVPVLDGTLSYYKDLVP